MVSFGRVFVIARDVQQGRILLGGLGVLSVGEMWVNEEPRHKNYDGYADAAERSETTVAEPSVGLTSEEVEALLSAADIAFQQATGNAWWDHLAAACQKLERVRRPANT